MITVQITLEELLDFIHPGRVVMVAANPIRTSTFEFQSARQALAPVGICDVNMVRPARTTTNQFNEARNEARAALVAKISGDGAS